MYMHLCLRLGLPQFIFSSEPIFQNVQFSSRPSLFFAKLCKNCVSSFQQDEGKIGSFAKQITKVKVHGTGVTGSAGQKLQGLCEVK